MKFNFNGTVKASLTCLCVLSLGGCGASHFASRETNPVIHDSAYEPGFFGSLTSKQDINTFATTASRRLVIVRTEQTGEDQNTGEHGYKFLSCAEPSPDVGEAFGASVAAWITAAVNSGTPITGQLAGDYARSVATQISPLVYRTQGLALYRDISHKLCIDRLNNWITDADYNKKSEDLMKQAITLITAELPALKEAQTAFYTNVKAGTTTPPTPPNATAPTLSPTK
jgi:hypothetical protein